MTEENRNITEIVETYKIVRSLAVEKDGFDMEHFDNDEQIEKSLKDYYQNEILVAKIKQKEAELEKVADEKNLAILKLKESQKNISNLISRLNNKVIQEIEINDNSSKKKRYKKPKNFILREEKVAKFEKLRMDAKSLLKS